MTDETGYGVLTDAQWAALAPLIAQCRPPHKTEHINLRRTIEAIVWRHDNGAKWRSIPPHLGPWWMAAQTFIGWSHHGVWERLLEQAQQREGLQLGMAFLDGSTIRAHQKAAGAAKKGDLQNSATSVRRLVAHAAASPPRPLSSWTAPAGRSASLSPPDRPMNCRWRRFC
jgi:transposase